MKNRSKLQKAIQTPGRAFMNIIYRIPPLSRAIDDEHYLKFIYYFCFGKKLDLKNPKTFSEKLQWMKLYDRRDVYTRMVDKYEAKQYVCDILGKEYIIPTLGVWDSFDDIDFESLPTQFVLKCTHDSGGLVICEDKMVLDKKLAKKKIEKCLVKNYYYLGREWPYKNVKPRIIAEPLIRDHNNELRDYKFLCFDGFPKLLYVASDRGIDTRFDFFDEDFQHLSFMQDHPNSDKPLDCPDNFEQMKVLAHKLANGYPELRVDFYNVDGKIYFGEITLFHLSGFVPFEPKEWDLKIGEMVNLDMK